MSNRWIIQIHPQLSLMEFKFMGFWSVADAEAWRTDYCAHVDRIALECANSFSFLVNLQIYPAQRAEVAEIHAECMAYAVPKGLVKAAHVVKDIITKMQMDKLHKRVDGARFANFLTQAEAEAWLKS